MSFVYIPEWTTVSDSSGVNAYILKKRGKMVLEMVRAFFQKVDIDVKCS